MRRLPHRSVHLARRVAASRAARTATVLMLLLGVLIWPVSAQQPKLQSLPTRLPAPSLDGGGEWINTGGPLTLKDLRGKFVVLDFWTYCCINCMHILPDLKKLEQAYPNQVVVIGVHSAKFATERDAQNVREAVVRYDIEHPVINDGNMLLWRKYGVSVWPTLKVIDPEGFVIASHQGEISFDALNDFFRRAVAVYRRKRVLDESPVHFELERERAPETPLLFPGKVLADAAGDRLFIADSGHNRIVITSLDGKLLDVIGSGAVGTADGEFAQAQFDHPQGMALFGDSLFVADTENHMIRRVDLRRRRVVTVAGTGKQATGVSRRASPRPKGIDLASPWDLTIVGDELFIAMAGAHQIWKMSLDGARIAPYAGNGVEDVVDGPLLPRTAYQKGYASFAQPSGLAVIEPWLFVADSEGSSIRGVPLDPKDEVATVLGTSHLPAQRLFTFGDRDGGRREALLQHPIGLTVADGRLFVADTYNNKIKEVDLKQPAIRTLVGSPLPGSSDEPPRFDEPAGLSAAGGKLYVADTNNHAIRIIDLNNENQVETLEIDELKPPASSKTEPVAGIPGGRTVSFAPTLIQSRDGKLDIAVEVELPAGYKMAPWAPMNYQIRETGGNSILAPGVTGKTVRVKNPAERLSLQLPLRAEQGVLPLELTLTYYFCRDGAEGLCRIGSVTWDGRVTLSESADEQPLQLRYSER